MTNGTGWLVRTQLRRSWRSYVGLALLIGLAGGLVIAGFAGARRNASAFDRLVSSTDGWDVLAIPDKPDSPLKVDEIRALPQVREAGRATAMFAVPADISDLGEAQASPAVMAGDGTSFYRVGRPLVREGTMPAPDDAEALVVDQDFAEQLGLKVGDSYPMRLLSEDEAYGSPPDIDVRTLGTVVSMRVAALVVGLDGVAAGDGDSYGQAMTVSPALLAAHPEASAGYWGAVVKLRSPSDVEAFRAALTEGRAPDDRIAFQTLAAIRAEVASSVDPQSTVLLVFSTVALVLAVLLVGQAIWRQLQGDSREAEALSGLGVTHRQRFGAAVGRIAATAVAGTLMAVVLAVALSPMMPIGDARVAEPDLGVQADVLVLAVGAALLVGLCLACAILPAWRTTSTRPVSASARPSWVVARVSRGGAPAPVVAGVRFALDPGRGRTSVPVRTTLIGAVSGVLIIAASLTFASSLRHFTSTPSENGGVADATLDLGEDTPNAHRVAETLDASPAVRSWVLTSIGELVLSGERVQFVQPLRGDLRPAELTDGRAPGRGEVVVGLRTLDDLGASIGDTVEAAMPSGPERLRIVGTAVFPLLSSYSGADKAGLGTGAWVAPPAAGTGAAEGGAADGAAEAEGVGPQQAWVSLTPGADRSRLAQELEQSIGGDSPVMVADVPRASIVRSLSELDQTPLYLAFLIAALVAATVIHALTAAVWRRRHEIALLQTVGFTPGQVRRSVLVQASVIGLFAMAVGLPLGIMAGRWAWDVLTDALGAVAELTVPWSHLVVVTVAVLVLVNLVGLVPATRVLRRRPAEMLRAE